MNPSSLGDPVASGRKRVRIATLIGAVAPSVEFLIYLANGPPEIGLRSEWGRFYWFVALLAAIAIVALIAVGWFLVHPLIHLISQGVRAIFATRASEDEWQLASDESLWTLPYAATAGVVAWLAYSVFGLGGWPGDVVFGAIAYIIGGWCLITLVLRWISISRQATSA